MDLFARKGGGVYIKNGKYEGGFSVILIFIPKSEKYYSKKYVKYMKKDVLKERPCQNWFSKCPPGSFNFNDAPHFGRPVEANEDKIKFI